MKNFRIIIQGERYPMEYSVQASNFATAAARGVRIWHERFKGERTEELKIKIIKGGSIKKENV